MSRGDCCRILETVLRLAITSKAEGILATHDQCRSQKNSKIYVRNLSEFSQKSCGKQSDANLCQKLVRKNLEISQKCVGNLSENSQI